MYSELCIANYLSMNNEFLFQHGSIVADGDCLWLLARKVPWVYQIRRSTGELSIYFETFNHEIYDSMTKNDDRFYLFSSMRGEILIFDMASKTQHVESFEHVFADSENRDYKNWAGSCICIKNKAFFGWQNPVVAVYDFEIKHWQTITGLVDPSKHDGTLRHLKYPLVVNNEISYIVGNSKTILIICGDTLDVVRKDIKIDCDYIINRVYTGKRWFIVGQKEKRISIFESDCELNTFNLIMEWDDNVCNEFMYSQILFVNGRIILIPDCCDNAYVVNVNERTLSRAFQIPVKEQKSIFENKFFRSNYFVGICVGNKYLTVNIWTLNVVIVDLLDGGICVEDIKVSKNVPIDVTVMLLRSKSIIQEGEAIGLNDYINAITQESMEF